MDTLPQPAHLLDATEALARQIWSHRRSAANGTLSWVGPRAAGVGEPIQTTTIGPYFYSGTIGISFFYGALFRVLRDEEHRGRSLESMSAIRSQVTSLLESPSKAQSLTIGIGGAFGLGSLIYTFTRIGQFLNEEPLIEEAHRLSALLSPEKIARDELLDVVVGSAGAILALLALHDARPDANDRGSTPLDVACECAQHLLARRSSSGGGPRAWTAMAGHPPLSGFSHGAAGICYTLLKLYERTGWRELLEAAEEGLAYERTVYSPEQRNWGDMRVRGSAAPRFLTNWCHGAPGVALGRLGALHVLDGPEIREEIRVALETTEVLPQTRLDHLCCGNLGRVEIMAYGSRKIGDPRLLQAALKLTGRVLSRARRNGCFGWAPEGDPTQFDPAFFTGASGIGYALLRLAVPDVLPFPLLLD